MLIAAQSCATINSKLCQREHNDLTCSYIQSVTVTTTVFKVQNPTLIALLPNFLIIFSFSLPNFQFKFNHHSVVAVLIFHEKSDLLPIKKMLKTNSNTFDPATAYFLMRILGSQAKATYIPSSKTRPLDSRSKTRYLDSRSKSRYLDSNLDKILSYLSQLGTKLIEYPSYAVLYRIFLVDPSD